MSHVTKLLFYARYMEVNVCYPFKNKIGCLFTFKPLAKNCQIVTILHSIKWCFWLCVKRALKRCLGFQPACFLFISCHCPRISPFHSLYWLLKMNNNNQQIRKTSRDWILQKGKNWFQFKLSKTFNCRLAICVNFNVVQVEAELFLD